MNKVIYIILSLLIFVIIAPFFNAFFAYILLSNATYGHLDNNLKHFMLFLYLAYITTCIPALVTGFIYSVLSPSCHKTKLMWFVPMIGCVIYLIYAFIVEIITPIFGKEFIYFVIIFALLSIGGTFIATLVANKILKKSSAITTQTKS